MTKLYQWTLRTLCALALLSLSHGAYAVPFEKVLSGGDPQNRVDIAIVGDGYTAADMAKYKSDVQAFIQKVFQQEPYREYKAYFNVWRLDVASAESGADHPERTPPVARNTYFGATYNCAGIQRLICVDTGAVMNALSSTLAPSQYDIKLVIVNDPEYGGSGGSVAVASTNVSAVELILHEVGHSFGLLADEYDYSPPTCNNASEPPEANATRQTQRASIKWTKWIAAATTVPTTSMTSGVPGLYQGAKYCTAGLYRPTYDSKMRSLGPPFEQINTEQLVRRVYNFVSPVDSYSPAQTSLSLTPNGSQVFKVSTPLPLTHALSVQWFVDDQPRGTGPEFTLDASGLASGVTHTVRADVKDTTAMVKNDPGLLLTESQSWTVTQSCAYSVSPTGKTFGADGGGGSVNVTDGGGCGWTAASNVSWISVTSGASGTGGGVVNYSVQANTGTTSRVGTMTIAGKKFTVTQSVLGGLSVGDVAVTESNAAGVTAAFTVRLSRPSAEAVTVKYATANRTAVAPGDYTAVPATILTFDPGQTTKTVTVQVAGDLRDEAAETFRLLLSAPTKAVITDNEGVCSITDNDPPPSITITNATIREPDSGTVNAAFSVRLSAPSGQTVTVKYATGGGTAAAGADYTALPLTTLTFSPGQYTKTIVVPVKGDLAKEANETFFVNLSAATGATIGDGQGLGTILNDD
jgi:hypothetical protein